MRKDVRTTPEPLYFRLPEGAILALVQTRDHLHLMARLTEPTSPDEEADVLVSLRALAALFDEFAADVNRVIVASRWPGRAATHGKGKPRKEPVSQESPDG